MSKDILGGFWPMPPEKSKTPNNSIAGVKERNICTPENPYSNGKEGRWHHPDAIEIDEDYGRRGGVADGDYIRYECPNCKHKFWVELPN